MARSNGQRANAEQETTVTIAVRRSDLAWMLGAVIPHVHRVSTFHNAAVGLEERGEHLLAYALDGFSAVVARAALLRSVSSTPFAARIPARPSLQASSEASDLLRYVRPGTVAEREQEVELLATFDEVHAAVPDSDGHIYKMMPGGISLEHVLTLIQTFSELPGDQMDMVYSPALLGKFASAQRVERDRVTLYPKRSEMHGRVGIMVVTIGANFIGGVAGMTNDHEPKGSDVMASFLQTEQVAA